MAKEDTFYFSHDYNARNDSKIKRLLSKHGYLGYGLFWAIIEDLYNNANALPTDYDSIAFDLRTDSETIKSIINDFDLFIIEVSEFGSKSVERRLNERNAKSAKARQSALDRWNKSDRNANALPSLSDSNAIKEKKEKEKKEELFNDFWNLYDKKVGDKDKLLIKFSKLSQSDIDSLMAYIPQYKIAQPEKKYRKNPEAFLNNKTWKDEIIGFKETAVKGTYDPTLPAPQPQRGILQ